MNTIFTGQPPIEAQLLLVAVVLGVSAILALTTYTGVRFALAGRVNRPQADRQATRYGTFAALLTPLSTIGTILVNYLG